MMECFGPRISADRQERNHRFLEEALELVQALGSTASEAHQLVDYVYGRPAGDPVQEVGGVMVTLAALCLANGMNMHAAGETELARIWTKVEQIRAKQLTKPAMSPLPGVYPERELPAAVTDLDRVTAERDAAKETLERWHELNLQREAKVDALQQRLTAAVEREDALGTLVPEAELALKALNVAVSVFDVELADSARRGLRLIIAALKPTDGQRNQCDGCQAGIPVVNGAHRMGKPGGYPDTMSCTAKLYADDRPAGCCCPPRGHVGLWAGAMCPVHYGLRAIKPAEMLPADHKCIECDSEYCHGVCVERGDSDDRLIG